MSSLQEPLINYIIRANNLAQDYTQVLQYSLHLERLNLADSPETMDPFENPLYSDAEATRETNNLKKSGYYSGSGRA